MVKKRPPIYSQVDARWKKTPYGTDTIGFAGCGLCAMASAVTGITGNIITPVQMKELAEQHHDKVAAGTSWAFFEHVVEHFPPMKCEQTDDFASVLKALKDPNTYVISSMHEGHFTKRGHFILLCDMDAKGNIIVNDSAGLIGATRSKQAWSQAIIKDEAKQFWIISSTKAAPAPAPKPQPKPAPVKTTKLKVIAPAGVNVRTAPNTAASIVKAVPVNTVVNGIQLIAGWWNIGPSAYIKAEFLKQI